MKTKILTKRLNNISKLYSLFLCIITVAVFYPTFFNDFQRGWDDTWQVLEHYYVINNSFREIIYHFTVSYEWQYSPVNTLFYIVLYKLFGFNPLAFHTGCLVVHILNVLLVYSIIKDVVLYIKPKFKSSKIKLYAVFVALIFSIHPLQVESVAWISASKVVIYAFFMLSAIWCYLRYIQSTKRSWLIAIATLYALSFGSKEQAIILPLSLLAIDYIYGRFKTLKFNKSLFKKRVLLEKIPFFGLALGFYIFSLSFNLGNIMVENTYPFHQRLLLGMHSMVEYILRFLAPVKLYFYYFYPIKTGENLPLFYWAYLVLTIIIGAFIWSNYKKNNRLVIFGFLFFIVNILLVLHIVPMPRNMITADRYMYISIIGLALIGVWYFDSIIIRFYKYKRPLFALIILYIISLGIQSHYRTKEWKDSETMKKNINKLIKERENLKQPIINNPLKQEGYE